MRAMATVQGTPKKETRPTAPARPPKIRVVLVDGQTLVRAALRSLIAREHDMEVVGDVADGPTAVTLVAETRPDVAVIDLSQTGTAGLASSEAIRRACPETRLLVLGQNPDASAVRTAIGLGVTGYVIKEADAAEVVAAIRAVYRGRLFIALGSADAEVGSSLWGRPLPRNGATGLDALSGRERHVLTLVAHGYTSREIAQTLSVSAKTVETYRARLSAKLGRHTRAELVQFALESGLLKPGGQP